MDEKYTSTNSQKSWSSVGEVARLFLKLGTIAFGGPAAHIAMMQDEVCHRRRWMSEQRFLDFLGAANLIPGPNSTEMAIYLGYERAGWRGLIAGGVCFILPAMFIVMALAWAYVKYGATPQAVWLLYGIKPVIVAIIFQALLRLIRTAVKGTLLAVVGVLILCLYLMNFSAVALIFGSGLLVMAIQNGWRFWCQGQSGNASLSLLPTLGLPLAQNAATILVPFNPATMFLTFLKIGSVVFGSGYVLLAFLRNDFVHGLGWLTDHQILDAVAVGQFTPGPVFTTATFIGYLLGGTHGALLATAGIFLPSFFFAAAIFPLVEVIRRSPWASAFLDGVNVGALGLMAGVTWQLGRTAIVDWPALALALMSAFVLFRFKINSCWIVLAGGAIGLLYRLFSP
ncbi:MAG TPA: chromate efflux transporter [Syntrophales bacterium]|nr:chromate efflux transporter [Syntrophales bacterium]